MDGTSRGPRFVLCAWLTAVLLGAGGFALGFVRGVPAGDSIARAALTTPTGLTSAAIVIPTGDGVALRGALAAPPADASAPSTTIQNLDQFVAGRYPGHPETAAVLRARGFAVAAGSAWALSGERVTTELVQFRDADGAQGYLRSLRASFTTNQRVAASFPIPNVGDGYAYVLTGAPGVLVPASPGGEIDLFAQVGPIVAELVVVTTGPPDRENDSAALVRQTGPLEP